MFRVTRLEERRDRFATRRSTGIALLEIMIAVSIFSVAMVVFGSFLLSGSRAMSGLAKSTYATTRLPSVMDRIVSELVSGRFASMDPPIPAESTWMRFEKVVESGSPPLYGNPIQIELVPIESDTTDGVDNDGNGLVDESGVRIWEDIAPHGTTPGPEDLPAVVITDLTADGLKFTRDGAVLLIEMTHQAVVERGQAPVVSRLQSGVRMRNSN